MPEPAISLTRFRAGSRSVKLCRGHRLSGEPGLRSLDLTKTAFCHKSDGAGTLQFHSTLRHILANNATLYRSIPHCATSWQTAPYYFVPFHAALHPGKQRQTISFHTTSHHILAQTFHTKSPIRRIFANRTTPNHTYMHRKSG